MEEPPDIESVVIKLESALPICRVCLEVSMEYIEFEAALCVVNGQEITYSDGFREISSPVIDLPKNLPTNFCVNCATDLLNAYLFVKRVENANYLLNKVKSFTEEGEQLADQMNNDCLSEVDADDCTDENGKVDSMTDPLEEHFDKFIDLDDDQNSLPLSENSIKIENVSDLAPGYQEVESNAFTNDYTQQEDLESIIDSQDSPIFIDNDIEAEKKIVDEHYMSDEESQWTWDESGQICDAKRMLTEHHKEHFPVKCKYCDRVLSTSEQLDSHLLYHQYNKFIVGSTDSMVHQCTFCAKKCRTEVEFVDHINVHKGTKPYKCNVCTNTFHTKNNLRLHKLRVHKAQEARKRIGKEFEKCKHCDKVVGKSHMEKHVEEHSKIPEYICTVCGKQFITKFGLNAHSLAHKEREFICHMCNKVCLTEFTLKKHIQYTHLSDRKKYQCEDCGLVFQYPSHLRDHQRKHNVQSRFQCPHCDRSYCRKPQLDIHMRYHNNDFRYKCDQCDKCYVTKSNLMDHIRSSHTKIMYDCDKCDQKFKSVTGLRKHKYIHTGYPYNCPLCSTGQTTRSGMKAHLFGVHKDAVTEDEFNEMFPIIVPKTGFRRPRTQYSD